MAPYNNTFDRYYNPYTFSPISKRVYKPSWRNMISQDIPFSDGISGSIGVTFEALTPLIIKDGKDTPESVNLKGNPFIPGTSVKGMVRNVLEIITLSKIGPRINDDLYSMRDLTPANQDYTLKNKAQPIPGQIKSGLLVKINGNYGLIKCPNLDQIHYDTIGIDFKIDGRTLKNKQTVKEKYDLLGKSDPFIGDEEGNFWIAVFTGFMNKKNHEFYFKMPTNPTKAYNIPESIKNFLFVYENETKSDAWKFWKTKIKNFDHCPSSEELCSSLCFAPVFYTLENNKIRSLGLSFLHRELYKYSIHDFLDDDHKANELDLPQCIFGSSDYDFKGRVQFSHSFVEMNNKGVSNDTHKIILGSPKPTFYPFYLKQDSKSRFASTFSDENGEINGWKRYLIHGRFKKKIFEKWNKNIGTEIKPLPEGVSFTTKIRFHNLKPAEVGALLSALTFHNNSDRCFHQIGMAKPLGYGKLKLTDIKINVPGKTDKLTDYMELFEKQLCREVPCSFDEWKKDITPLFTIATGNYNKEIHYPGQGKEKPFEDFKIIKIKNHSIIDFSPKLDEFELKCLNNLKS